MNPPPFSGLVLAGGASRRMGRDKAMLSVGGVALGRRVLEAFRAAGASELLAVGGDSSALGAQGWTCVPDRWPGEGPLGAIVTGLERADHGLVVVMPVDVPSLDGATVAALAEALAADADADAAVPLVGGRVQPLSAAYRRTSARQLEQSFVAGERAPRRALERLRVHWLEGLDPDRLADVDTPDEVGVYEHAHRSSLARHVQRGTPGP